MFLLMIFLKPFLNDFKKIIVAFMVTVPTTLRCIKDIRCSQLEAIKSLIRLQVLEKRIWSALQKAPWSDMPFGFPVLWDAFDSTGLFAF